jgi:hypothetical protein
MATVLVVVTRLETVLAVDGVKDNCGIHGASSSISTFLDSLAYPSALLTYTGMTKPTTILYTHNDKSDNSS